MGRVTLNIAWASVHPRVLATCSYLGLIPSKVDLMILSMKGTFTKNWAITIPAGVKTKTSPVSASSLPGMLVPKKRRRPTPATRGGRDKGMSRMALTKLFPGKW